MMNLPLLMATPAATPVGRVGGRDGGPSPDGDSAGFEATLTALLGDAGKEVVDMVEALGKLADLDREHDALAAIGWPMPALLAMTGNGGVDQGVLLDELTADLRVEGDAEVAHAALPGGLAGDVDEAAGGDEAEGEAITRVERPGASATATAAVAPETAASVGTTSLDEGDEIDGARGAPSTSRSAEGTKVGASASTAGTADVAADGDHLDIHEEAGDRTSAGVRTARGHAKSDVQVPATTREPAATDRAGSFRVETSSDRAPAAGEPLAVRPEPARPAPGAGMSSAIQRVMEAIDRLETLPPPQRLTVDLGEVRIRVSMEDGQVRMAVIDGDGDVGDELLQDARDELAQRGFDLGTGAEQGQGAATSGEDTNDEQSQQPRTRERVATGLRL